MTAATARRQIPLGGDKAIAVGALAGTTVAHGFLPDLETGSSCIACYGWQDDYRHTHRLWLRRQEPTWN